MLYCEIQLGGDVKIYEMSDARLLLKVGIQAEAACLPIPNTMHDAHDYLRAGCYEFHCFDSYMKAEAWVDGYSSFRAGEVKAEFRRYAERRADYRFAKLIAA